MLNKMLQEIGAMWPGRMVFQLVEMQEISNVNIVKKAITRVYWLKHHLVRT